MEVENLEFHISSTGDVAANSIQKLGKSLESAEKSAKKSNGTFQKLIGTFKRLALFKALRTIINAIAEGLTEGLKNAYQFSTMVDGKLASALNNIASSGQMMKNQIGSAFGELLTNLAPIITAIENFITRLADAVSRLFAILGGRSTYNKATAGTKKWADATASGAKAAKEWKNQLMGFDEINRLEAPAETSGGGGGSGSDIGKWEEAAAHMKWAEELKRITDEWLQGVNFEPLINAWNRLKDAVSGFVAIVDKGLRWAYENVLLPLAGWTIETAAPAVVNLLASAFEFLNAVLEKLSPLFQVIFENWIKPIAQFIGDVFIGVVNFLTDAFSGLAEKLSNASSLSEFFASLDGKEKLVLAVATAIAIMAGAIAALSVIKTIASIFQGAVALITNPWLLIGAVIALVVYEIITHWEEIKEKFKAVIDAITGFVERALEIWNKVKDGIRTVAEAIANGMNWKLPHIPLPHFTISGEFSLMPPSVPRIAVEWYAKGGFPDTGELFVAREAGAELVGSLGGKTAVANNDQIVEGITSGVRNANEDVVNAIFAISTQIIGAMRENSSGGSTDWDAVARQVTRYQHRHIISANA